MTREHKRILLVEPEPVLAEITAFRLELHGYLVVSVDSGEAALQALETLRPDLILTDLTLPGLDGMGLVEKLALDETTAGIPIVVMSADADLDRVQAVYHLGARDYVVVPYQPDVLEEKVARHLAAPRPVLSREDQPRASQQPAAVPAAV